MPRAGTVAAVDLSTGEREWFETWRSNQADSGIVIQEPWGATKLEGLLYQAKNQGLREAFFKEEHLAQIRELHTTLQSLLPDIAARLNQDAEERERARRSDAINRQADELAQFVHSLREAYLATADRCAGSMGHPGMRPGHWEVVIRPSW